MPDKVSLADAFLQRIEERLGQEYSRLSLYVACEYFGAPADVR